jgi:hypothetical protein
VTGQQDDAEGASLLPALVEEACRKSALLWVRRPGDTHSTPAWHVWLDGAVYVVHGGLEQPLPDLAAAPGRVEVTVRSKDKGGRLVTWVAAAEPVNPGSPGWDAAAAALHAARLSPPDGEEEPSRWARESWITRLVPTGEVLEHPGAMLKVSHAAPPVDTPATTRNRLPFVLGRRGRGQR